MLSGILYNRLLLQCGALLRLTVVLEDNENKNGGRRPDGGQDDNPFEGYDAPKAVKKSEKTAKPSRKIAYAAVAAAIASVSAVATVYLPTKILPLVIASFCFFLAYVKCGIFYGIAAAVVTSLITFLCGGLCTSLIMLAICFFPYSLLCLPLRRFGYKKPMGALIRISSVVVFVNIAFVAVYFTAEYAVLGGMDIVGAVGNFGKFGYLICALIVSAVAAVTDVLFVMCDKVITPKLK